MAEPQSVTARRKQLYIPEENSAFIEAQNAPPSAYERMKQDAVRRSYDEALRLTGSEERARSASRMVANRLGIGEAIWTGIIAPEAALAGAGRLVGAATQAFGRGAPASGPVLRNALTAEERLALPAPRSGPAIEMPPPRQAPPPARDVRSAPDELARFEGEGGLTADEIAAHRQAVLDRISAEQAFRQRQLQTMEGEGGAAPGRAINQRRIKGTEDAAFRDRQMSALEGEGGITSDAIERARQIAIARLEGEAARREMEIARFIDEGGGMAMNRPMEQGVRQPGTGFTLGEGGETVIPPRPTFTRLGEPSFGLPAIRPGSEMSKTGPLIEGNAASNRYLSNLLSPAVFGALGLSAGDTAIQNARDILGRPSRQPEAIGRQPGSSDRQPIPVREMDSTLFGEDSGPRPAPMRAVDSTLAGYDLPRDIPMPPRRPTNIMPSEGPMPPPRPREVEAAKSILSSIFGGQNYQSNNRPVVEDRKVNWGDSDRASDFFRAERAARELGILPPVERASGGQVDGGKPPKDAALTKALEIIHDLLRR